MGPLGRSCLLGTLPLLVETTSLLTSRGETTVRPSRMLLSHDPLDVLVILDHWMERIHQNDLVVLDATILAYPVGIEDLEIREVTIDTLLGNTLDGLAHGDLAQSPSLGTPSRFDVMLSEATSPDTGPDNDKTLLCLEAELSGPVEPGRVFDPHDSGFLSPLNLPLPVELLEVAFLGDLPGLRNIIIHVLAHRNHFRTRFWIHLSAEPVTGTCPTGCSPVAGVSVRFRFLMILIVILADYRWIFAGTITRWEFGEIAGPGNVTRCKKIWEPGGT